MMAIIAWRSPGSGFSRYCHRRPGTEDVEKVEVTLHGSRGITNHWQGEHPSPETLSSTNPPESNDATNAPKSAPMIRRAKSVTCVGPEEFR